VVDHVLHSLEETLLLEYFIGCDVIHLRLRVVYFNIEFAQVILNCSERLR